MKMTMNVVKITQQKFTSSTCTTTSTGSLVDFKAIYPGVPPGVFASFPGVAHFLSFEQICQYPRESRKSTSYPGVLFPRGRPRGNPNTLG